MKNFIKYALYGVGILGAAYILSGAYTAGAGTQTVPIPATSSYMLISVPSGSGYGYRLVQIPDCSNATTSKLYYNSSTQTMYCGTDQGGTGITTTTGNWLGTWQGVNSSTFYLASNPSGYVTSSVVTGYVSTTTGNWIGTWQGVNSSTFYLASNPSGYVTSSVVTGYVSTTTGNWIGTWQGINSSTFAKVTNNLSDLQSSSTARTKLGLTDTATIASSTFLTKATNFHPIQWIIENPTASENDSLFIFRTTSTMNSCFAVNKSVSDTITFGLGYSNSRATATSSLNQLFSSVQTVTATTTPATLTINASSTPGNLNAFRFWTTAASSSQFTLTCYYTEQ